MTYFPNLARDRQDDRPEVTDEVNRIASDELVQAGIGVFTTWGSEGEVPASVAGECCTWIFTRKWRYWVAEGPGIPPDAAEEFHKTWGTVVRVAGHCGCPSPLEWCKGFAVGLYHIDTQEGLTAFAALLKSIYRGE